MKKTISKLTLDRETVRVLAREGLSTARGGSEEPPESFIECADSVTICGPSFGNCNLTFNFRCVPF